MALADGGVGGEKDNAQRMLDSLLKKHGLTLSDISDEVVETYWFKYKGKLERRLLGQIISTVANGAERWTCRAKRETLGVDTTKHQMLEIGLMFGIYKKALNDDIEILFSAFVHTNKLFPPSDEKESLEQTPEERARTFKVFQMMQGMDKVTMRKSIEAD